MCSTTPSAIYSSSLAPFTLNTFCIYRRFHVFFYLDFVIHIYFRLYFWIHLYTFFHLYFINICIFSCYPKLSLAKEFHSELKKIFIFMSKVLNLILSYIQEREQHMSLHRIRICASFRSLPGGTSSWKAEEVAVNTPARAHTHRIHAPNIFIKLFRSGRKKKEERRSFPRHAALPCFCFSEAGTGRAESRRVPARSLLQFRRVRSGRPRARSSASGAVPGHRAAAANTLPHEAERTEVTGPRAARPAGTITLLLALHVTEARVCACALPSVSI